MRPYQEPKYNRDNEVTFFFAWCMVILAIMFVGALLAAA